MEKKDCLIHSVYPRKDIDGTVLWFTVGVKEVGSEYIHRYDFGPASFEKTFGFKDPDKVNTLVWQHCYMTSSLSLK